jgi:hypothetical protein
MKQDYRKIIKESVAVDSSHIADISYRDKDNTLIITWKNGKRYEYANVDKSIYDEFLAAPSKGVYLNTVFKPMKLPYTEVL